MTVTIMIGDVRDQLRKIESNSIHCVVTSPPYWGLRDYGVSGQLGLEKTPGEFVAVMVEVFEEVRRVLREDGTCWINMGDSYAAGGQGAGSGPCKQDTNKGTLRLDRPRKAPTGLKPKDLCMMPHRLAIALQDAGWWVRQDIVWSKPNPMPESVTDRCTKSHEYIFLLTKSARYFYDAEAIKDPVVGDPDSPRNRWDTKDYDVPGQKPQKRVARGVGFGHGTDNEERNRGRVKRIPGNINPAKSQAAYEAGDDKHRTKAGLLAYSQKQHSAARALSPKDAGRSEQGLAVAARFGGGAGFREDPNSRPEKRNKRSVWTMATHSFPDAHFATFPPELPETCIKAGCPHGGVVLDPFFGAGTTGLVADRLQRECIGIELNPVYAEMARDRIQRESPMFADVRIIQDAKEAA